MTFTPLRDFENDYEVEIDEPHRIRRIGGDRFVTPYVGNTGYAKIHLNRRTYQYHGILAKHLHLPNPDNLTQVDHIDRNPLNNRIDNLRWVSNSENARNRTVTAYGRREYLNAAPNDITEIRTFNDVEYEENKVSKQPGVPELTAEQFANSLQNTHKQFQNGYRICFVRPLKTRSF